MSGKSVCNRCIQASTSPDGQVGHAQLSSPSLRESVDIYASDRPVIPVVFLPGVMGSNLYNTKTKEVVWAPGGPLSTLWKYGITFDSSRQKRLDVTGTELYSNGEITAELTADYWNDLEPGVLPPGLFESEAALRVRGWGGVFGSSYHAFMSRLQHEMNTVMLKGAITPLWQKLLALPLQNYGVKMCCASLTGDDLKNVAPFRFEVWGGGYNWLEGNTESARKIQHFIETTVLPHYKKNLATNNQVILVTHSMGGASGAQFVRSDSKARSGCAARCHACQWSGGIIYQFAPRGTRHHGHCAGQRFCLRGGGIHPVPGRSGVVAFRRRRLQSRSGACADFSPAMP